ncbi:MAG: hypothetical protein U1F43_36360 [Myxococcota bacterium]
MAWGEDGPGDYYLRLQRQLAARSAGLVADLDALLAEAARTRHLASAAFDPNAPALEDASAGPLNVSLAGGDAEPGHAVSVTVTLAARPRPADVAWLRRRVAALIRKMPPPSEVANLDSDDLLAGDHPVDPARRLRADDAAVVVERARRGRAAALSPARPGDLRRVAEAPRRQRAGRARGARGGARGRRPRQGRGRRRRRGPARRRHAAGRVGGGHRQARQRARRGRARRHPPPRGGAARRLRCRGAARGVLFPRALRRPVVELAVQAAPMSSPFE